MHQSIADWASGAMYHGQLRTHESVAQHVLSDLMIGTHRHASNNDGNVSDDGEDREQPALLLVDTAGCGMEEGETSAGSRFNQGEAQLVVQHVQTLLRAGIKPEEIAVISPYNGQVELLRTLLLPEIAPKLEIRSVDGFQVANVRPWFLVCALQSQGCDWIPVIRDVLMLPLLVPNVTVLSFVIRKL
ncbi:hypothetical protein MHU86_23182 [Fragilaria crotonensis]|nr:hypothetical protein MHU86_23182 [Fragilaria crotonensis]